MPTRERIKELLPVMTAYAEGKAIQLCRSGSGDWLTCDSPHERVMFSDHVQYRVAPEPERIDGAHAACDVSDGKSEFDRWDEVGIADDTLVDQSRAWWHDDGVWKPARVRLWDPGVLVLGNIAEGQPIEFNPARLEIRRSQGTPPITEPPALLVLGLTGLARSGKDTLAQILVAEHGFTRVALADGIKESFRSLDGPTEELSKDIEAAGKTRRWVHQTMGSEAREDLTGDGATNLWLDLALAKIRYLSHYHPKPRLRFVIPDVRMPHEPPRLKSVIKSWGGKMALIRVDRPGAGLNGDAGRHKSETAIKDLDADIVTLNVGSIRDLAGNVENLLRMVDHL